MINANHQSAAVFKDKKTYNLQAYIDSIGVAQHSYKQHTHTHNHGEELKFLTPQRPNVTVVDEFVLVNTLADLLRGCPKPTTLI